MSKYIKIGRRKHLSEKHRKNIGLSLRGRSVSQTTREKISIANMGRIGANLGKKFSKETKLRMSLAQRGEKNANWKSENVSYSTVHKWLVRMYGKANHCVKGHIAKKYDWANKTGKYLRDINDWHQLCRSCNMKDGIKAPTQLQ